MEEDAHYFTVMPMSQMMDNLEPGETYTGEITVVNPATAKEDFHYKAYAAPYSVVGTDYGADMASESNYTMIKDWIKIEEPEGVISPNSSKKVKYSITVPKSAPAGGQYAAIMIGQDPDSIESGNEGMAVKDVFEMASVIYANVAGETIRDGEIQENNVPQFVLSTPITIGALLTNNGNVHELATVIVEASDLMTGQVIVGPDLQNNTFTETVMPGTTYYAQRDISEGLPLLGIVRVKQTVRYNGKVSEESKDVIICPIWFMAAVTMIFALIIAIIVMMIRKHRKNKIQAY